MCVLIKILLCLTSVVLFYHLWSVFWLDSSFLRTFVFLLAYYVALTAHLVVLYCVLLLIFSGHASCVMNVASLQISHTFTIECNNIFVRIHFYSVYLILPSQPTT